MEVQQLVTWEALATYQNASMNLRPQNATAIATHLRESLDIRNSVYAGCGTEHQVVFAVSAEQSRNLGEFAL